MKKIFAKISLLFIGLMLCAGNVWATATFVTNPPAGASGTCTLRENNINYTATYNFNWSMQNVMGGYTYQNDLAVSGYNGTPGSEIDIPATVNISTSISYISGQYSPVGQGVDRPVISVASGAFTDSKFDDKTINMPATTTPPSLAAAWNSTFHSGVTVVFPEDYKTYYTEEKGWPQDKVYAGSSSVDEDDWGDIHWAFDNSTKTLTISGSADMPVVDELNERPWHENLDNIEHVVIDNGVTSIGNLDFYGCTNLEDVTIANSVTSIERSAFQGCRSLTTVTIDSDDSNLATIGTEAFDGCSALETITIPASVTTIGALAFKDCGLKSIYAYGTTAPTLSRETDQEYAKNEHTGQIVFFGRNVRFATSAEVTVPSGKESAYRDAWGILTKNLDGEIVGKLIYTGVTLSDDDASTMAATLTSLVGESYDGVTTERPVQLSNQYNTLCLPFSMDADQISNSSLTGAEIYEFANAVKDGDYLDLHFRPVTSITAGIPYFIRYPQDGDNLTELDFVSVTFTTATAGTVTHGDVTLVGTLSQVTISGSGKLFLAANNTLKWYDGDKTINPFRAYFSVAGGMSLAPKARIVAHKNTTTDVESVQSSAISSQKIIKNGQLFILKNGVKYNAQGQVVK